MSHHRLDLDQLNGSNEDILHVQFQLSMTQVPYQDLLSGKLGTNEQRFFTVCSSGELNFTCITTKQMEDDVVQSEINIKSETEKMRTMSLQRDFSKVHNSAKNTDFSIL